MCGIAMIMGAQCPRPVFDRMVESMAHRGEIDEIYSRPGLLAATRRLPIVDRAQARQPWQFEDGELTLCYNGEIYNTPELADRLRGLGVTLRTDSDTEIVAQSFALWRESAVERFEGEFAFAVAELDRIYVARDPIGVKPLYYAIAHGRIHVASEIKSLVHLDAPVIEVPAGWHGWISAESGARLRPHFDTRATAEALAAEAFDDEGEAIARVRAAVTAAIESRVQTDLPIAVVLSGGLDSTIVAAQVARVHPGCTAFTIGTPDSPDIDYAARVAKDLGLRHEIVSLRPRDLGRSDMTRAVRSSELTEYGDIINAAISMPLFERIRECGFKVAIGGDCSDELFGGYPMYDSVAAGQQRALFLHKLGNLSRTELQRVDRASMAATVEMRVPFLDRRVVDTALRLPMSMKVRDGQEKWVLRRAFEGVVPDYVITRPKHGLSYSSGLHDRVRLYKPWVPGAYRQAGYSLHSALRRDFDRALSAAGNDLDAALSGDLHLLDYTSAERLKDLVGAARWNLTPAVARLTRRVRSFAR